MIFLGTSTSLKVISVLEHVVVADLVEAFAVRHWISLVDCWRLNSLVCLVSEVEESDDVDVVVLLKFKTFS